MKKRRPLRAAEAYQVLLNPKLAEKLFKAAGEQCLRLTPEDTRTIKEAVEFSPQAPRVALPDDAAELLIARLPRMLSAVEASAFATATDRRLRNKGTRLAAERELVAAAASIKQATAAVIQIASEPLVPAHVTAPALIELSHLEAWLSALAQWCARENTERRAPDPWRSALLHELSLVWTELGWTPTQTEDGPFARVATALLGMQHRRSNGVGQSPSRLRNAELKAAIATGRHERTRRGRERLEILIGMLASDSNVAVASHPSPAQASNLRIDTRSGPP